MDEYSVAEIWRYPVKSMGGEKLLEATVSRSGILFDRCWAIRDEETKTIRGAKHLGGLMEFSAKCTDAQYDSQTSHVEITTPSGAIVRSDDPEVNQIISRELGREVSLWPLMPASDSVHYSINATRDGAIEDEIRRTFGLKPSEPIPDMSEFPAEMLRNFSRFSTPLGTYFDAYPISILTRASLSKLAAARSDAVLDVRRFRPNILLRDDQKLSCFAENEWLGQTLRIGGAEFEIEVCTVRCVMVTRAQPGLERDGSIMRALIKDAEQKLGVYATVTKPSQILVGDAVELTCAGSGQ